MKNVLKKVSLSGLVALAICAALIVPSLVTAQEGSMARRISDDYKKEIGRAHV